MCNNKFESIIKQIKSDNSKELESMSLLEYVKSNIEANQYWFFTADTDEEVDKLNADFIEYVS